MPHLYRFTVLITALVAWIFVWILLPAASHAGSAIDDLALLQDRHKIKSIQYYLDDLHHHTPKSIREISPDYWSKLPEDDLNLGYSEATAWLKFTLQNTSQQPIEAILDVSYPLLDFVNIYQWSATGKQTLLLSAGDGRPFAYRPLNYRNLASHLQIDSETVNTYYISIRSNAPIQSELLLWNQKAFEQHYDLLSAIDFLYLGFIFCAAFAAFIIFYFVNSRLHLVYGLYAIAFALTICSQQGILFQFITPDSPAIHNWSQLYLSSFTTSLAAYFCHLFLKLSPLTIGSRLIKQLILLPILILVFSPLIGYSMAIKAIVACTIFTILCCFAIGIHIKATSDYHFKPQAKTFLFAWTFLFCGALVFLLTKIGLLPFNELTNRSLQLGSTFELIIFAFALARRINLDRLRGIQIEQSLINEEKKSTEFQEKLIFRATHDLFTDLPNHALFETWFEKHTTEHPADEFSICLIHVSRISEINKTLGHEFGQQAIELIATRLNNIASNSKFAYCIESSEGYYVASIGPYDFLLVLHKIEINTLNKLKNELDTPLEIKGIEIQPAILIGYSMYPSNGKTPSQLIRQCNVALDNAKSDINSISQYDNHLDSYNKRRLTLITDLSNAITQDALEIYYQPILATKENTIEAGESLLRWPHPSHGMLMPGEFINIAEQFGVIKTLTGWLFLEAIKQLEKWNAMRINCVLTINISALNLHDASFVKLVEETLKIKPELAKLMTMEITESQMMQNADIALRNAWRLNELGIQIAIDDFGTGYSSLNYLSKLPAKKLKIDKSFVINLEENPHNQTLVATTVRMAQDLEMQTVAEGVESLATLEILQRLGCNYYQGFYYSRAIPEPKFTNLLHEQRHNQE